MIRLCRLNARKRTPPRIASSKFALPSIHSRLHSSDVGLMNLPVHSPQDWVRRAHDCIDRCNTIVAKLANFRSLTPSQIVQYLDTLSDTLCCVADPAELCSNAHVSAAFATAASDAVGILAEYISKLNASRVLFEASVFALRPSARIQLTEEELSVGTALKIEFEHNGVHLGEKLQAELFARQAQIQKLTSKLRNALSSESPVKSLKVSSAAVEKLPNILKKRFRAESRSFVTIPLDTWTVDGLLLVCEDPSIRQQVYTLANSFPDELQLIESLLVARHDVSKLLGFESFSHSQGWNRVLASPTEVLLFLDDLAKKVEPYVRTEISSIQALKFASGDRSPVSEWDLPYWSNQIRASQTPMETTLSEYFPINSAVQGFADFARQLFGISMTALPTSPSEIWAPSVTKLSVDDSNGKHLGSIYLDLYSRRGKFQGAANFPIRFRSMHSSYASLALLCNHDPPTRDRPSLLSFHELTTLWHELGHSLQTLLSNTTLQHFAGTRSRQDSVEVISLLFEYFARDYRVLRRFGRHWRTGEVVPEHLVAKELHQLKVLGSIDLQSQIFLAALDQHLHGPGVSPGSSTNIAAEAKRRYSSIPFVKGTAPHARFGHLITYASTYYGYLASGVNAFAIWDQLFSHDPFCKQAGFALRDQVLSFAGLRTPQQTLPSLLQQQPSPEAFIKNRIQENPC